MSKRRPKETRHHIIPKSRGGKGLENLCYVPKREHQTYHALFDNKTPNEIIHYLTNTFWNGDYSYLYDVYEKCEEERKR